MRTTLDIDDDVLVAAKHLAAAQKTSTGKVISALVRQHLTRPLEKSLQYRDGFPVLPKRGGIVTSELVQRLDEDDL